MEPCSVACRPNGISMMRVFTTSVLDQLSYLEASFPSSSPRVLLFSFHRTKTARRARLHTLSPIYIYCYAACVAQYELTKSGVTCAHLPPTTGARFAFRSLLIYNSVVSSPIIGRSRVQTTRTRVVTWLSRTLSIVFTRHRLNHSQNTNENRKSFPSLDVDARAHRCASTCVPTTEFGKSSVEFTTGLEGGSNAPWLSSGHSPCSFQISEDS